jgi:hypothetical protein
MHMNFDHYLLNTPQDLLKFSKESSQLCGEEALVLNHPGGPYVVEGLSKWQKDIIQKHYSMLVLSPDSKEYEKENIQNNIVFKSFEKNIFKEHELKGELYEIGLQSLEMTQTDVFGPYFYASIEKSNTQCFVPYEAHTYFIASFVNLIRVILALNISKQGGLAIHSSSFSFDGEHAYAFYGRSGDGKSTLGHKAIKEGAEVLSDDLNLITRDEKGVLWIEGIPCSGELGHVIRRRKAYRLKGLFDLEKSKDTRIKAKSAFASAMKILAASPFANSLESYHEELIKNSLQISNEVVLGTLEFSLEEPIKKLFVELSLSSI